MRIFGPIFILILLLTFLPIDQNSAKPAVLISNSENIIFDPGTFLNLQQSILNNIALADKNGDKIADNLNMNQEEIDAIILFEDFSFSSGLTSLNLDLLKSLNNLPVVQVRIPRNLINTVTMLPGLAIIEENVHLQSFLAYSTAQFGLRPYVWDLGIQGSPSTNAAVIDSGIDYNHPAVSGKVVASYNFLDGNTDSTDDHGHGTFVSHIISGSLSTGQTFTQTSRGLLPPNGFAYYDISIPNLNETIDITFEVDWGSKGNDFPGGSIFYGLQKWDTNLDQLVSACGNCLIDDTSGLDQTTFTGILPGDYLAIIGTNSGAEDQPYEIAVTIPQDPELPHQIKEDGYPEYSGVAPGSKIVALKVTDASDSGTVSTFLDAMDWVIDNHILYNITVVNLSVGIAQYSAVMDSTVASLTQKGVVVVVAAGNDGKNSGGLGSPASAEQAITVGAINRYNEIAYYSSNGADQSHIDLIKPDVVAPGGSQLLPGFGHDTSYEPGVGLIVAADANGVGYNIASNDMVGYQGTSFSAPHIAGLVLLLVQKLMNNGEWVKNENTAYRIKRAILAGTFEVGNIGSNGGEGVAPQSYPDQKPSINRISKDYVEGWGAVSAQAALGALSDNIGVNTLHNMSFALEDPFVPNVYAWNFNFEANVDYQFKASVPAGADLDLLLFDANIGTYGDLNLLGSATHDVGVDEELTINFTTAKKAILVVRLVDSFNTLDHSSIQLYFPNFTPNVEILSPIYGSYLSTSSINLQYTSQSNQVELILDGVNQGIISPEYLISGLSEGIHNITIFEENQITGMSDVDTSIFTVDLTNPEIASSSFLSFDSQTLNAAVSIDFAITDNIELDRIELIIGGVLGAFVSFDGTSVTSSMILNPTHFRIGNQIAILRVYDQSGRIAELSISLELTHQIYVVPHFYSEIDGDTGDTIITWEEFSVNPLNFSISINDSIINSGNWDGSDLSLDVSQLGLGIYEISLEIYDTSLQMANDSFILLIFDASNPRIDSDAPSLADANGSITFTFTIDERFVNNYTIYRNDDVFDSESVLTTLQELTITLENIPGEMDEIILLVFDQSSNYNEESLLISWVDDTPPIVVKSDDINFEKGKATGQLSWNWIEKFPEEILILLDGAPYNQVTDFSLTSFVVNTPQLNSLDEGSHEYRFRITDLGGNVETVRIFVDVLSSQKNGPGFIFFNFNLFLVGVLFGAIITRKIKSRSHSARN